mgnify:CR=1 FL=1
MYLSIIADKIRLALCVGMLRSALSILFTDLCFSKITKNINSKLLKNPKLYSPKITEYTSEIAKIKRVRQLLRGYQRKFAAKKLAILEGRDMGILFSNADVKIFFKCSLKVASKRRFKEFKKTNNKMLNSIQFRDFSLIFP